MTLWHRPIVVGTDFSEGSLGALRIAMGLGVAIDAAVRLVHVAPTGGWEPDADAIEWLTRTDLDPGNLVVRTGAPWAQIVRYAIELEAGLVAVGTHGRSGFQPLAPGSTTARLLTHSPVPVIATVANTIHAVAGPAAGLDARP